MSTIGTGYSNFVLENKMTDLINTKLEVKSLMTIDDSLAETAGLRKTINKYTYTGQVEKLTKGAKGLQINSKGWVWFFLFDKKHQHPHPFNAIAIAGGENIVQNQVTLNIQRAVSTLLPEAIMRGLEDALQLIENEAVELCPVDDGQLRASITHVKEEDNELFVGMVGSNVEYAPYVHEGTGIYAKEGHGRQTPWSYKTADGKWHSTKGKRPQPFLQNAIDANIDTVLQCFEGVLEE